MSRKNVFLLPFTGEVSGPLFLQLNVFGGRIDELKGGFDRGERTAFSQQQSENTTLAVAPINQTRRYRSSLCHVTLWMLDA